MKKTILKWILLIALLAYTAGMAVWAGHKASAHKCRSIDIIVQNVNSAAVDSATRSGVQQALSLYPLVLVNMPLNSIDTRKLEKYLARLRNLEEVHCVITADRRLQISVVPLIPEIRVFTGDKSWYVNKVGKAVPASPDFFADVPVVTGNFKRGFQPREVLPLARFIKTDKELSQIVSMIVARDKDNLLIVPRISGHIINFGDTTRLLEKKRALLAFYRNVMPYKGWNTYDTISVKFKGQVVATRRDKSYNNHGAVYDDGVDPEEAALHETITTQQPANSNNSHKTDSVSPN